MEAARVASRKTFGKAGKVAIYVGLGLIWFLGFELGMIALVNYLMVVTGLPVPFAAMIFFVVSVGHGIAALIWCVNYFEAKESLQKQRIREAEEAERVRRRSMLDPGPRKKPPF